MPGSMSISGVVSGLQTDDIISKIMDVARKPEDQIKSKKTDAQNQLTAWQDLNSRVLALKLKCDFLATPGSYTSSTATSSDTSIVTATASDKAQPGTFYLNISSRAQSHQIGCAYQDGSGNALYTSLDSVVGYGTMHVAFASADSKYSAFDVTTDASNNTLSGLRDAINKADKGVTAAIINRGTTASPVYQLVLTSDETGTANRMTVTTSGWSGGTAPDFAETVAHERTIREATDAIVTMGDGADKVTVTSPTNTITDLIPGVTLNVLNYDSSKTVRVDVARDTKSIISAAQGFIQQFNDLADAIDKQFTYDSQSGDGGPLMSSNELRTLQADMMDIVTGGVTGVNKKWNCLAAVGITLGTDGHLVMDDSDFSAALNNNIDDVRRLFSYNMESDSSYVSFLASTSDTKASPTTGWQVDITQAARRAQVTAGTAMAANLGQSETLTINNMSIGLTANMTPDEVVAEINKNSSSTGVKAVLTGADGTGTGNYLTLQTVGYGSKMTFTAKSSLSYSTAGSTGIGTTEVKPDSAAGESGTGTGLAGLDVAGTINDGKNTITCQGNGQILTTDPDDTMSTTATNGLSIMVTANAPMSTTVYYTKGTLSMLRDNMIQATSKKGIVTTAEDSLNTSITDYDKEIADMEERLQDQQERLYTQFSDMESQLAKLQDQSNSLSSLLGTSSSSSTKK